MNELIQKILEWPIILQGALGSGLFWLILVAGQKFTAFITVKVSKSSRKRRLRALREEGLKCRITLPDNDERATMVALLVYRALRHISFGLIWLALGLAFQAFIPTFGLIGYLGALFYLFNAARVFKPIGQDSDKKKRISEIDAEIEQLEQHNKSIQPTADAAAD